jgi:hypothetical protein
MSLHTDWANAKKDSKTKFKVAVKAKRDALEKQIKTGDAKARAKMLNDNLDQLGLASAGDDVDKYYTFKEDFGPNLDTLEKANGANAGAKASIAAIKSIDQVLQDGKLSKAFAVFAKQKKMDDFYAFITVGYKADPAKAYAMFIKAGAPLEINVDAQYVAPLHAIANNPAQLKSQGPALLVKCRTEFINAVGADALSKFKVSPELKAVFGAGTDLSAMKKKVTDASASYRQQIGKSAAKWSGIQPDFRKPLLDALSAIDTAVAAM